jgi:hypothetical protein
LAARLLLLLLFAARLFLLARLVLVRLLLVGH